MKYVIRFENGVRQTSIACDNEIDRINKLKQAEEWAKGNTTRKVIVSNDSRPYIKLVSGKIRAMTQAEINAIKEAHRPRTPKENLLELLDDTDVIDKIKDKIK